MPSYVSQPFPADTEVTVHFSHGIFQTIVLEDNGGRCWPLSSSDQDVILSSVTLEEIAMPLQVEAHRDYYGLSGILIPLIKAKLGVNTDAPVVPSSYRSTTLDAAMRGEGRASALLETMPRLMARNPSAVMRGRNDSPRTRSPSRSVVGTVQENDQTYRWLSSTNMCSIEILTGRIINRHVTELPTQLMVLREHPQFLIHRS